MNVLIEYAQIQMLHMLACIMYEQQFLESYNRKFSK